MAQKRRKPALRTGSGWISLAASDRDNTETLSKFQAAFVAARFRLAPEVAAVVAGLLFRGGALMPLQISIYQRVSSEGRPSSSKLTVMNVEGPDQPHDDAPPFSLVSHHYYVTRPVLYPINDCRDGFRGPMASGLYAGTSDPQWQRAVGKITGNDHGCDLVAVHDRFEEID